MRSRFGVHVTTLVLICSTCASSATGQTTAPAAPSPAELYDFGRQIEDACNRGDLHELGATIDLDSFLTRSAAGAGAKLPSE